VAPEEAKPEAGQLAAAVAQGTKKVAAISDLFGSLGQPAKPLRLTSIGIHLDASRALFLEGLSDV